MQNKPRFLITVDTEGDNIWDGPKIITTKNASYLYRFQELCEKYYLKPVYLVNYEMATSQIFIELAKYALSKGAAEIGLHIHAWHSPPNYSLTTDDFKFMPYLIEYPVGIMEQKIEYMTKLLEDTFQQKIISHRAGRWALNAEYAKILIKLGYKVDCSVTPHLSWANMKGAPNGKGGVNYRNFPENAYFMDPKNIGKQGNSSLLEVPVTIMLKKRMGLKISTREPLSSKQQFKKFIKNAAFFLYEPIRFIPKLTNLENLLDVLSVGIEEKRDYVEMALHSSELMPGGSNTFKTEWDIENLYSHLEKLFEEAAKNYSGSTLAGYHDFFVSGQEKCKKSNKNKHGMVDVFLGKENKKLLDVFIANLEKIRSRSDAVAIFPQNTGVSWLGIKVATQRLFPDNSIEMPQHYSNSIFTLQELKKIAVTIRELRFEKVVLSGFSSSHKEIIQCFSCEPAVGDPQVFAIHHGSFSTLSSDPFSTEQIAAFISLARCGKIKAIGCVKKGLSQCVEHLFNVKCFDVLLKCPKPKEIKAAEPGQIKPVNIGVFVNNSFWKNLHTQIVAAAFVENAIIHAHNYQELKYLQLGARLRLHEFRDAEQFLDLLGSMTINFHVTFTETFGQVLAESLSQGVPCITAYSSGFLDYDEELKRWLVVEEYDNPVAIHKQATKVLDNRVAISRMGLEYIAKFNKLADEKLNLFLGRP